MSPVHNPRILPTQSFSRNLLALFNFFQQFLLKSNGVNPQAYSAEINDDPYSGDP